MTEITVEQSKADYEEFKSLSRNGYMYDSIYNFISWTGKSPSEIEEIKNNVKNMTKKELGNRDPYHLFFGIIRDINNAVVAETIYNIFHMKITIEKALKLRERQQELSKFFVVEKLEANDWLPNVTIKEDPYLKSKASVVVDKRRVEGNKFMPVPGTYTPASYY